MNRAERNEMIEEYGRGFDLLTAALAGSPPGAWEFIPAPGEWSIHEIVLHMADSESIGALRLRKLIAEPGSSLMPYDEAKWAQALDYRSQNTDDALESFRLARHTTYHLLKTLPDEVFTHSVFHPEFDEPYTLEHWLNAYADHVPTHVTQLKNNYRAWKELNH
jgi:DinB superfamily